MTPLTFPPSFFTSSASPSSSSSFSQTGPTSWNSAPRPRLKRSHSSSTPAVPVNSPEGPLSPSLASSSLLPSPHSNSFGTRTTSTLASNSGTSEGGLGQAIRARPSLTVIDEVPQAETLATSPIVPNPLLSHQPPPSKPVDEEDRPSKSKRRRTAPDHEAFGRLSLDYSPIPSNSSAQPFSPFPPTSSSPASAYTLTSPVQSSFPPVPPTSPDFLPFSHHHHQQKQNLSTSPPPLVFPPSSIARASGLVLPHSQSRSSGMEEEEEPEIEMSKPPSSWDISPHTIYVSSLSSSDDEDDSQHKKEEQERERETFRLNSLASSSFNQPILPRRQKPADALILYQPPPSLRPPEKEEGRKMETRVERLRREEMERRRNEEFGEFRREAERVEGGMDADTEGEGEGEGGEGMEMEMEL